MRAGGLEKIRLGIDWCERALARLPAWSRRRPLTTLSVATALLCLFLILFVDQTLAQSLKIGLSPAWKQVFVVITDLGLGIHWFLLFGGGLAVCLILSGLSLTVEGYERWRLRARSWLFGLTVMTVAGIGVQLLKLVFGRPRPKQFFERGLFDFAPFSGGNSFPSGHSQAIWSAAVALWFIYPPLRPLYVIVATVIALSRVMVSAHYLSDVVAGSVTGIVFAVLVARVFARKDRPPLRVDRTPQPRTSPHASEEP